MTIALLADLLGNGNTILAGNRICKRHFCVFAFYIKKLKLIGPQSQYRISVSRVALPLVGLGVTFHFVAIIGNAMLSHTWAPSSRYRMLATKLNKTAAYPMKISAT